MTKAIAKILLLQIILLLFNGCQYRSQNIIDSKLIIDQENIENDLYKSKNLDQLFNIKNQTYFEPDYVGSSFENYYVKNIIIKDGSNIKSHYLLLFDKEDILKDTLKIPKNQVYSLNVKFANHKNGISTGIFDEKTSYFRILKNFEINKKQKLIPLSLKTKIIDCPLPIEYLSEENVGIEDSYNFGINENNIEKPVNENKSDFPMAGMYSINADVESLISEETIKIKFNFYFENKEKMNLRIQTDISEDAYCEGQYQLTKNKDFLIASYADEGICTDNIEDSRFYVKTENSKVYIKSKRFLNQDWQVLRRE
ncbi:hypothetical protein [Epilithonimonas sp.]|uniref:hypothetical protein n=1 Tax=Epilithonimonas sp. TaxID=2894511 RepID=UPI002FDE30A9